MKIFSLVKSAFSAALSILGAVFSLVLGIGDAYYYFGSTVSNEIYGGDAYTGIQNAAAATANNISRFGYAIERVLVFIGLILFVVFLMLFLRNIEAMLKAIAELRNNNSEIQDSQHTAPAYDDIPRTENV